MNRVIGMVITFAVFLGPGFYRVFYVIDHGRAYIKLTGESFICFRRGKELKILWHEIEWVDYITKVMDIRRGYEKIGIVFKLLNGREIELDTWGWGFGQDDVTNLMRDISVKIKHQDQT